MAILSANNLSQNFGNVDIFSGISVSIPNDGKIGLVGPNGIGKTTLLLILAGRANPASGQIHLAKGRRIGYLTQESADAFSNLDNTVYDEMLTLFAHLRDDERALRQMEADMGAGDDSDELLAKYSAALERFEREGGYDYQLRIKRTLTGLGFPEERWDLRLAHMSGGQKTRALLARLLLARPDLLVLDEPTNHLDIAAIEWLENQLNVWDGALLIVSHDRYFLNKVVNIIWEMSRFGMEEYRGNYSHYVSQRQDRWERRKKEFDDLKERLLKELDYIKRNIASQRTQMAKGKLSRLSRELLMIESAGVREVMSGKSWARLQNEFGVSRFTMGVAEAESRIRELRWQSNRPVSLNLNLTTKQRSGHIVLRTKNLHIGYPNVPLFTADDIELHRLECAALIGPNGTGKTTFLKTILGDLDPLQGSVKLGASLKVGYFAQAHSQLDPDKTILDTLLDYRNMGLGEARNYLAQYLFRSDDVYKQVSTLSGGERGRVALSLLALEGANFLLLDEPTNHLDIPSQEVLQEVLEHFEGTILLVTHDRYLVDRLATQIWDLRDGYLQVFEGPYQEFLASQQVVEVVEPAGLPATDLASNNGTSTLSKNEARRLAQRLHELEVTITTTEAQLDQATADLQAASEAQDFDKIQSLSIEYEALQQNLEALMAEWENLAREQELAP